MLVGSVEAALEDFRAGRMVILVDDEDRENEGDLCIAAEKVTPEAINFMALHGRGLICLAMTEQRLRELDIPMMVSSNTSTYGTAFTVSIEAKRGVSTGISAHDRATTILATVNPASQPSDFLRPGHVFPLKAREGGVLVRTGQTEGSVDMARLAGLQPAAVICEIMNDDGSMARMGDLERFASVHGIRILSVADLIQHRLRTESLITRVSSYTCKHPLWGDVQACVYLSRHDGREHLALVKGDLSNRTHTPLVRVHAEVSGLNVVDELFGVRQHALEQTLQRIAQEPCGVVVCLDRGHVPLTISQRMNLLTEPSPIQKPASEHVVRDLGIGAQILRDLGIEKIRVLSDHVRRMPGLEGYGVHVEAVVPMVL